MLVKLVTHKTGASNLRVLLASMMLMASAGKVLADTDAIQLDIKSGPAGKALLNLAEQAGVQITLPQREGISRQLKSISGEYTLAGALDLILDGSGLVYEFTSDKTVIVKQANTGLSDESPISELKEKSRVIEEITVTATKRETRLQDTPMAISALSADNIEKRGLLTMSDYLSSIPGVTMQDSGPGENKVVIRGVGSGPFEDASTASYFGEAPLNSLSSGNATGAIADIKLVDMARVEVLRGPQGTLYGSGSMSGTVRNIPNAPNLQEVEGKIEVGYSQTARYGGDNTKITGVFNVPLVEDELAVRLVAYQYDNSGYIKNVGADVPARVAGAAAYGATTINKDNVGAAKHEGVRGSLRWRPNDRLDVTIIALTQESSQDGWLESDLTQDPYQATPLQITAYNERGEFKADTLDLYNMTIKYDFDSVNLLSSTSYYDGMNHRAFDLSRIAPALPVGLGDEWPREGLFQELRLNSSWDGRFQFITGVYYEKLDSSRKATARWIGDDALCCSFYGPGDPDNVFTLLDEISVKQIAIFGELSYDITDEITATFGSRWFDYSRMDTLDRDGLLSGGPSFSVREKNETGSIFKANLSYQANDDTLIYAQWTQGFRLGQPGASIPASLCDTNNDGLLDGTPFPLDSKPSADTADNYELGSKLTLLDNRLVLNSTVYRIDWNDIPIAVGAVPTCGFGGMVNLGKATTKGLELEATYYATPDLKLGLSGSVLKAELSEDTLLGPKGARLGASADFNAHADIQYDFNLAEKPAFIRADYTYISGYSHYVNSAADQLGGYGTLGMRAGISFDNIDVELYGSNLTNKNTLIAVGLGGIRVQPRVVGMDVRYHF